MNAYEQKRLSRIDRLENAIDKARAESTQLWEQASKMADIIPMGQPILVGHHSEKRDRNYRDRIWSKYKKSVEMGEKADKLASRLEAVKNNKIIFSDDPDATEKLADKLTRLEQRQALMVSANKLVRKNDRDGLLNAGFTDSQIEGLFKPDYMGRVGFPDYAIKNNSANIRRIKDRIKELEAKKNDSTSEHNINGVKVIDNVEENRLQLYFPGKPAQNIITELKRSGFRWAPSLGCWQAYRSNNSAYAAKRILNLL